MPSLAKKLGIEFDQFNSFKEMIAAGALGEKVGRGFYAYSNGKVIGVTTDAIRVLEKNKKTPPVKSSDSDIVDRCILLLLNEASRCLMEEIGSCEAVDLVMVHSFGFPRHLGGLLQYADTRGIKSVVARLNDLSKQFGSRFEPTSMLQNMAKTEQRFYPHRLHMTSPVVLATSKL